MNVAEQALAGSKLRFDVSADVNETAAIVLEAKRTGGKSGVLIVGGGSPKNFMLQTEPQIQEVLGIDEKGHDYFLQITDARPDTGGLSGATPAEAVSWGKIDPDQLPGTVVVYADNTIALPLLTAYALARHADRPLKRLYGRARGDDGAADRGVPRRARLPRPAGRGVARAHAPGGRGSGDGGSDGDPPAYRWYALGLLAVINLLNYIDRNVIFALFEPIKRDLALTDAQLGWLGSAYILVFSVAALPFGVISDLRSRRAVIAGGVTVWSAFTFLSGLVRSYWQLFTCRAAVGVGEAAYGPAAASLVADYFPGPRPRDGDGHPRLRRLARRRARACCSAGISRATYGWRVAFMTVGVPGFLCALLVARLHRSDPAAGEAHGPLLPARLPHRRDGAAPAALAAARERRGGRGAGLLARPLYGADSKLDVAAFSAAVGARARDQHPLLGAPDARRTRGGDALRRGDQQRLRRHPARRQDGAAHADAGLRLPRRRDDLVRHQRHRGLGADVRRRASCELTAGEGAALLGKWGLIAGASGTLFGGFLADWLRRRCGDRPGDHRRRWGFSSAGRSRSGC